MQVVLRQRGLDRLFLRGHVVCIVDEGGGIGILDVIVEIVLKPQFRGVKLDFKQL